MKIEDAGDGVGVEGAGDQQGGGEAAQAVPDSAAPDRSGGVGLVAGGDGMEEGEVEQAGAHAEHQKSGDAPPVGERRRDQREVEEGKAGEGAGEGQQEGDTAAAHDGQGEARGGYDTDGEARKKLPTATKSGGVAVIDPGGQDGTEQRQQKSGDEEAGQRATAAGHTSSLWVVLRSSRTSDCIIPRG